MSKLVEPIKVPIELDPVESQLDALVQRNLLTTPPADDEAVYSSPSLTIFEVGGKALQFFPLAYQAKGRPARIVGGLYRTKNKAEQEKLDAYCSEFSGNFRKVFPA